MTLVSISRQVSKITFPATLMTAGNKTASCQTTGTGSDHPALAAAETKLWMECLIMPAIEVGEDGTMKPQGGSAMWLPPSVAQTLPVCVQVRRNNKNCV